ncbi:glycosyl transferase [Halobacteriales archaeon QS_8_69_26]|nr:MAG: glycosyl transferase [Halobacteriales archaeon QS_8_69_26]
MASVVLPTRSWGSVASDLAGQLSADDELLVVCDAPSNPVADRETPEGARVVVAGGPEGCSGKCNAVAAGMEAADCDRFVWTDDDFDHPEGWLDDLVRAGERHGPVTEIPVFVGDGWWRLFEPTGVAFGSTLVATGDIPWAGGVTFTRDELADGVDALVADLRRSVSDDGILADHLTDLTPLRDRTRRVEVDGSPRAVYHRLVRNLGISYYSDPAGTVQGVVAVSLLAAVAAVSPLVLAPLVTALSAAYYRWLGFDRSTWLLAYPSLLCCPARFAVGLAASEFEWAGRRYRWTGRYEVEVLDR